MRLNQWKDKSWADTEALIREDEIKKANIKEALEQKEKELEQQFESGELSETQYRTMVANLAGPSPIAPSSQPAQEPYFYDNVENETDIAASLTDEDKLYLAMKWGKLYRPHEWVELERMYEEMTASFDIRDADTTNTLILVCKTNLKMNQALDQGDLDGFQKLSRVFESLRKSAKFTAAQNKNAENDEVDCVGVLVSLCEKEGFIPRFAIDIPQDKVDFTLKDMNNYLNKLVTQDLGFGQQIENALKKIRLQKEQQEEMDDEPLDEFAELEISDEDMTAFYEDIQSQRDQDDLLLSGEGE